MDYKKIIRNQEVRFKILKILDFIPDKYMVKLQYKISTGRRLNLKNPKRFTEKLQLYKITERNSLLTKCADKYAVREYVETKGLKKILVPLYGVYNTADEIEFGKLPRKFVLKTTNGSHTNLFCENKEKLDLDKTREILNLYVNKRSSKMGREWAYYNIKPKIICEKYLDMDENGDLIDYKFFCFDGKVEFLYVISERNLEGGPKLGIYDLNFKKLKYSREDINIENKASKKPINFDEMIEIAKILSEDFKHVRVDLYNVKGNIIFGELTFYDGSGYKKFNDDEFDFMLGKKFKIGNG